MAEKRSTRRDRIIESARSVFFEDGFERANLDEVARRAGIAKGTIYRYFDSKGELYVEVLTQNADIFVERMRRAVGTQGGAEERMRRIGAFYFDHYTEHREYFRIFWALENPDVVGELPENLVAKVSAVWRRSLEHLAEVIEDGVKTGEFATCDPWEVANILWVMANAMIQSHDVGVRREIMGRDVRQIFDDAVDLVLRGLSPRARPAASPSRVDKPRGVHETQTQSGG